MKKILFLILSILYLSTSVGATVHFHYCMDRLVSWGLASQEEDSCTYCGMDKEKANSCCKDEHKQVKVQGEQKTANVVNAEVNLPIDISTTPVDFYHHRTLHSVAESYPVSNAPPNRVLIPVYLSNCSFLI